MQTENEPGQDSMEHAFVGSLLWMAPEILRHGGSASTEKSDIWSLGITAIELAEHEPPHSEVVNASELRHRILYTEMVGLSNQFIWSEEFQDFVNCCLKKDPILRPSAIELSRHPFIRKGESSRNLLSELLELLSR